MYTIQRNQESATTTTRGYRAF